MGEETMELREAKKKSDDYFASFDAIVYGGWIMLEMLSDNKDCSDLLFISPIIAYLKEGL